MGAFWCCLSCYVTVFTFGCLRLLWILLRLILNSVGHFKLLCLVCFLDLRDWVAITGGLIVFVAGVWCLLVA